MDTFHTWQDTKTGNTDVIFLNGFLGAGKTTLLNHLLRESGERNVAALVNDLGAINIDADLVKESINSASSQNAHSVVQLTNGCICCSSNSDLPEALFEIIETFGPDQILVESSGVAEPKNIYDSLSIRNSYNRSILELITVTNMVTVVDPLIFLEKWHTAQNSKRRTHLLHGDPRQPLIELMVDQIEYANLILLSKSDLSTEQERIEIRSIVSSLNDGAEIEEIRNGELDSSLLFEQTRYDSRETMAVSDKEISHDHHCHSHNDYGLETFLFTARKPFNHDRFMKLLREDFPGVIRAKGFYWTDREKEFRGFLSIAGNVVRADRSGQWFHALLEKGYKEKEEMPDSVRAVWDEQCGDRRQEIVFIGIDLNVHDMATKLNECLQ